MISDDNRRPEQIRKMENGRYALFEGLVRAYISSTEAIHIEKKKSEHIHTPHIRERDQIDLVGVLDASDSSRRRQL